MMELSIMFGRVVACESKQRSRKKPEGATVEEAVRVYQFVDRLPDGVTPEEGHERVIAALGALLEGAVRGGAA